MMISWCIIYITLMTTLQGGMMPGSAPGRLSAYESVKIPAFPSPTGVTWCDLSGFFFSSLRYIPEIPLKQWVVFLKSWNFDRVISQAPITPNFPSRSSREIVGDYVEK